MDDARLGELQSLGRINVSDARLTVVEAHDERQGRTALMPATAGFPTWDHRRPLNLES
jgi:hypothetical protein